MTIDNENEIELTGNESVDELEAMLDKLALEEEGEISGETALVDEQDGDTLQVNKGDSSEGDTSAASPAAEDDAEPTGILAADGKNIIPIDVLQAERDANAKLKDQLEQANARNQELEKSERLIEVRNKQLEEMGIEPADLPEDIKIDNDKLAELQEDYPEIANFILALNNKIEGIAGQTAAPAAPAQDSEPGNDAMYQALQANNDLNAWMQKGDPRWNTAQVIDDQLSSSPDWANKTYEERFAEVSKRVRIAFGDEPLIDEQAIVQAANAKANNAKSALPASPSELGQTNRSGESDLMNRIQNADADEMSAIMDSLSEDQMEKVLYESGF